MLEKIKLLQRKWNKGNIEKESNKKETVAESWNVWRKKDDDIEKEIVTTQNENIADKEISTPSIIKLPALLSQIGTS